MNGEKSWPIVDAALRAVLPLATRVILVAVVTALVAEGLLEQEAADACLLALGLSGS